MKLAIRRNHDASWSVFDAESERVIRTGADYHTVQEALAHMLAGTFPRSRAQIRYGWDYAGMPADYKVALSQNYSAILKTK